jgi:hypothetical protein
MKKAPDDRTNVDAKRRAYVASLPPEIKARIAELR